MNREVRQNKIVKMVLQVLESQLKYQSESITAPSKVIDYLRLQLEDKDREHFLVLFLNNQNQLITSEVMFIGTINATEIHPREIARSALRHNAAAVILAHNHLSGDPEPSQADRYITQKIEEVLSLIDIRTLDHFVIGHGHTVSFAERGWL